MATMGFSTMGAAARSAGVKEHVIIEAVRNKQLVARRIDDKAVILATDIQSWLEAQPNYYD